MVEQRKATPLEGVGSALVAIARGKVHVFGANATTANMCCGLTSMLENLEYAARFIHLPDAFFELGTSDWPNKPRAHPPPHLMLAVNTDDSSLDVPVPGGQFTWDFDTGEKEVVAQVAAHPWRSRQPKAVWRGTLMCSSWERCHTRCPRLNIRWAAEKNPDALSVRFGHHHTDTHNCSIIAGEPLLSRDEAAPDKRLTLEQQMDYRFIIASDGHSYASGLKRFLRTGCTVLRQRTQYLEFFDPALEPWVHHVPFDCLSADDCELVSLVRRARSDTDFEARMEAIANNGMAFGMLHLSQAGRACYWASLLDAVQPLFRGTSRLPESVLRLGTDISVRWKNPGFPGRRLEAQEAPGVSGPEPQAFGDWL